MGFTQNNWNGIGRIVTDLNLKKTKKGDSYVWFWLAIHNDTIIFPGQNWALVEHASAIECRCYGRLAETLCEYNGKGSILAVAGQVATDVLDRKRFYISIKDALYMDKFYQLYGLWKEQKADFLEYLKHKEEFLTWLKTVRKKE